ncbi:hypothetical protein ARMGADRAFT_1066639 [Armillaria gallica]|uniref:Uncharacterized protein n=1 Tax=Armillaria gallica TaxID=47427 RepID=A0A2H3DFH1_ARMGA|nr:hypothetical protein ARMGADRAFT_1066639 [Armillaria gallica]
MRPRLELTVGIELYRHLVLKCTSHKYRNIWPSSIRRFKDGVKSTNLSACKTHWRISRSFIIERHTTFSSKDVPATIVDVTLRSKQLQAGGYFWLMILNLQYSLNEHRIPAMPYIAGLRISNNVQTYPKHGDAFKYLLFIPGCTSASKDVTDKRYTYRRSNRKPCFQTTDCVLSVVPSEKDVHLQKPSYI